MENNIIVIVGQTAVGKTDISIKLAKLINGEIINGDAMQVYKGLDILTAKVKEEEKEGVIHHLLSFKNIEDNYSVEEYQSLVREKIEDILKRNKTPILVGGTGLYIKAALYDYQFEKEDQEKINCIEKKYQNLDNLSLFEELKKIDPESCKILHPNNRRRVLRALVIYNLHGQSKSNLIEKQAHKPLYNCKFIGLYLPKDQLNQRINTRVEKMFDNGIIEEVKKLNGLSSTASKAIGVPEIKNYLNNKINLNECKELIKLHTRQYSKRQMTWLKHQFNVKWFEISDNALIEIYNYLKGEDFLCGKK